MHFLGQLNTSKIGWLLLSINQIYFPNMLNEDKAINEALFEKLCPMSLGES